MGFRVPPAQDDSLKMTSSNPGNGRRQKDLDMRHFMVIKLRYFCGKFSKVDREYFRWQISNSFFSYTIEYIGIEFLQ